MQKVVKTLKNMSSGGQIHNIMNNEDKFDYLDLKFHMWVVWMDL